MHFGSTVLILLLVTISVLIFKGLDVNSDEDSVRRHQRSRQACNIVNHLRLQVRRAVKEICAMPLKDIRLIKDKNTDVSRGFCFVELDSMEVRPWLRGSEVIATQIGATVPYPLNLNLNFGVIIPYL